MQDETVFTKWKHEVYLLHMSYFAPSKVSTFHVQSILQKNKIISQEFSQHLRHHWTTPRFFLVSSDDCSPFSEERLALQKLFPGQYPIQLKCYIVWVKFCTVWCRFLSSLQWTCPPWFRAVNSHYWPGEGLGKFCASHWYKPPRYRRCHEPVSRMGSRSGFPPTNAAVLHLHWLTIDFCKGNAITIQILHYRFKVGWLSNSALSQEEMWPVNTLRGKCLRPVNTGNSHDNVTEGQKNSILHQITKLPCRIKWQW